MKTDIENKEQIKDSKKEQAKEQIKDSKREHTSIINNFIRKEITITLRSGNKIKGKLETVSQYELVITVAYSPVIVMKHAIDYIELT